MRINLLLILGVFLNFSVLGQQAEHIEVSSMDTVSKYVSNSTQYLFDEFTEGAVNFKDGKRGPGTLNYNRLLGEIQFIDSPSGDILALTELKDITSVTIGSRTFKQINGKFLELFLNAETQLAVEHKVKSVSEGAEGAFGTTNPSVSITQQSSSIYEGKRVDLKVNQQYNVVLSNKYHLFTNGKLTAIKGKKTFLKHYANHKPKVEEFVNKHNINFNNIEDLAHLINFCNKLE